MLREGEQFCLIGPKGRKYLLTWQPSGIFTNQDGKMSFAEVTDFGIEVKTSRGVLHQVIKPTAADLALAVKRLTTISYSKDMGFQLLHSTMQAGSTVLECGGGSGAMTSVLARFVGDTGKIHVFERRPEFLELARKNVTKLGLAHRVEWHLRDPGVDGFALEGVDGFEGYDAAFLDVPEPWALVAPAHAVLKPGASVSSLSPNVEQVRATVEKMIEVGFARIWTVELLERELLVRKQGTRPREMMRSHTGYLTFAARFNYSVPPESNKPRLEGGAEGADLASEAGEEAEEPIE
jgi:tRNA (adenine57-N1/adenine58-N1)-methyltransferase